MTREKIEIGKYHIIKRIEKSNYAVVYKVEGNDGKTFALKIAREKDSEYNALISREFQILSQFKHPNIVMVSDYGISGDKRAYFTSEFVSGKPVNECFKGFSKEFVSVILQIINAVKVLHNKMFIHCDIKPENILYDVKKKRIVLIDFGFAGIPKHFTELTGTVGYIAPEVIKGIGIDQRSDLYSLGLIIYEIFSGKKSKDRYVPIKNIPKIIDNLISRMVSHEPVIRPTIPEIYRTFHRFLPSIKTEVSPYKVKLPNCGFVETESTVDELLHAKGETIVIIGNTGMGKTRLLQEMKFKYLMQGYSVLYYISEAKEKFYESLLNFVGRRIIDLSNIKDRFQIYEEITSRLRNFAKDKSVVVMVDDIEVLSDYDLELFRYIGYGLKEINILLIGTSKSAKKIAYLGFRTFSLRPFSYDEIKELLEKTFFEIVPVKSPKTSYLVDFSRWLTEQSGGNPLFVEQILKTLYDNGVIFYKNYKWNISMNALKKTVIPSKIEDLLKIRFKGLQILEQKILQVLSLIVHPLEVTVISLLLKSKIDVEIEHLKSLGLLREEVINKRKVYISNNILVQLIRRRIKKEKRYLYYRSLIQAIGTASPEDKDYFPVLARLYDRVGAQDNAYQYFRLSAKNAELIYDYYSALRYYEVMLKYEKENLARRYPKTLLEIAEINRILGNNKIAIKYYKDALKCRRKDLTHTIYSGFARVYAAIGEHNDAVKFLTKAMVLMKSKENQDYIRIAVYSSLYLNQLEEGKVILDQSFLPSGKVSDVEILAETMFYQSLYEWLRGNYDRGIEKALKDLRLGKENKLLIHLAQIENLLSLLYLQKGNIKKSQKYIEDAVKGYKALKLTNALANSLNNKAFLFVCKGDFQTAAELYGNVLTLSYQTNNLSAQYKSLLELGSINEDMGKFDDAISFYNKAREVKPDAPSPDYKLSLLFCKKGVVEKAKSLIEKKLRVRKKIPYFFVMATINLIQGKREDAEAALNKGLELMDKKNLDTQTKIELLLSAAQFYYEKGDFENSLYYSENVRKLTNPLSREYSFTSGLIKMNRFNIGKVKIVDITQETERLKSIGCIYVYAYLERLRIESIVNKGIADVKVKEILEKLNNLKEIFASIGAGLEQKRVEKLQLRLFPIIAKEYSRRVISNAYLETFSKLAELISLHLGSEDFIQNTLDLIIESTNAERGALFIKTSKGMEFCAGRDIDKTTITDARELSRTAIKEIEKTNIIFTRDALSDKSFNIKKSVQLNKIRSLLCIPLLVSHNVIGALYLDSRIASGIFGYEDEDFLITVSRILASVIEKSMTFRSVKEENILLKSGIIEEIGSGYIIGRSAQMKKVYQLIERVAKTDTAVLLLGETGTGKGMLARLIHLKSKRKDNKFLTINCGTIPETLLESELFGHKRGAFTGAVSDKKGLLEVGKSGTVFLDEITNTGTSFQAKLLEVIEEKKIRRLGETKTIKVDVRFLFATNKDLELEVEEGRFRKDLFYRINVFGIEVPPLRERVSDISVLAQFFLRRYCKELNKDIEGFSSEAMEKLKENSWQGNVRELQNIIERAVVLAKGNLITLQDIGFTGTSTEEIVPLKELKKSAVIDALQKSKWNIAKAARLLGVTRRTIYKYIEKYNIEKSL